MPDNLVEPRPGRTSPRARKRGGSNRYDKRKPGVPAARKVTYTIVLHPLQPRAQHEAPP